MKLFLFACALVLIASSVQAGTTCTVLGNYTICTTTNPVTGQVYTTTCTTLGTTVFCN